MTAKIFTLLTVFFLLTSSLVSAGTITWSGGASNGAWETAANWSSAPAAGDEVIIGGSGTDTISINSTVNVRTLKISAHKLYLASGRLTLAPPKYRLSISKVGTGSGTVSSAPTGISCGASCTASFTEGTSVLLTAAADSGSVFTGWSDNACSSNSTCPETMNANTAISATFVKQTAAAFSVSHTAPYTGQTIQFTDLSTGTPASWSWEFGDGSTSTEQNPTHTYINAMSYTVKLTATNAAGSTSTTKTLAVSAYDTSTFTLVSGAASDGGTLPIEYTIDGLGASPALSWVNPPQGTTQYAMLMTTLPDEVTTLYNWVLYDIPEGTTGLAKNSTGVGTAGTIINHDVITLPGYAPPQSPGSGDKTYTFTLYALSGVPDLSGGTTGAALAAAIASKTVGTASLSLTYARTAPVAGFTYETVDSSVAFTSSGVSGLSASSWLWDFGDNKTSTEQNPVHTYYSYGTYTVTLTVTNDFGSSSTSKTFTLASTSPMGFDNIQTISDKAQTTTLAFSAFAMMNGNLNTQSFFPPGKVADYTGFQYMRDNDPGEQGHNTSFLTRVAENIISILTDQQILELDTLATAQQDQVSEYGYGRFKFMEAFRRLMTGGTSIPTGATGLSREAIMNTSRALYLIDGQISYDRAELYARILNSMTADQKAYMDSMKGVGWGGWPDTSAEPLKSKVDTNKGKLSSGNMVAVMTYAGDLFSWYSGSLAADVYFCPERQGTYYGGFYMKDAPAIGHEGYAISTTLTADVGEVLSDSKRGVVTATQAKMMTDLVETQRNNLYAGTSSIVNVRLQIATLLRKLLTTTDTAVKASIESQVLALSEIYGDLDGENNYNYATTFAAYYKTLSTDQIASLRALYNSVMTGEYSVTDKNGNVITTPFDFSDVATAKLFLYSDILSGTETQYVTNTSDTVIYPLFGVTYTGQ